MLNKKLINHNSLIIWNNSIDKIEVNKVGMPIDVIPTIYNLFGIEYDSRLFMGKDILSNDLGIAMFSNRSWVTDKGMYFTNKREFIKKDNVEIDDNYVNNINQLVNNRINMSGLIIDNNYYEKIFNNN